jgi:hypothetical protein
MNRPQRLANFMAASHGEDCMHLYFAPDQAVDLAAFITRSQVFNAANSFKAVILRLREGANQVGW